MRMLILAAAVAVVATASSAGAQQHTVRIGMVRALSATPTMIAIEKSYFREYGIKAEVSDVDTTALVPLAQNLVQVMEAGVQGQQAAGLPVIDLRRPHAEEHRSA